MFQMISVKCNNCSGELTIDIHGELSCPYCGSKTFFSDSEIGEYKTLRRNILNHLRALNDINANTDESNRVWDYKELVTFETTSGTPVNVRYTFYTEEPGVKTYVTKDTIVQVFDKEHKYYINQMSAGIRSLEYPSAAIKDLSKCFPTVKSRLPLKDGSELIAISKPENAIPLFAYGNLRPKHVAWIVSRMENFCCIFEYSGIYHGGISIDNVYINPRTHEGFLFGGWCNNGIQSSERKNNIDLKSIRLVADKLLGAYKEDAPELFKQFITSEPKSNAYDDFQMWDDVIVKGFGGHNFTKFETD